MQEPVKIRSTALQSGNDKVAYRYLTELCQKNGSKPKRGAAIIERLTFKLKEIQSRFSTWWRHRQHW